MLTRCGYPYLIPGHQTLSNVITANRAGGLIPAVGGSARSCSRRVSRPRLRAPAEALAAHMPILAGVFLAGVVPALSSRSEGVSPRSGREVDLDREIET